MGAAEAVRFGYKWKIGNGRSVRFWEDIWFGNSNLATQFWDIYFVCNQQTKTVRDIWDGANLRCDFRRTFSDDMMSQWQEVLAIAETIVFSEDEDQLIWSYETNGVYSSKSMYAIVNFRGVTPIYLPAVWDLKIPPRIQIFLWLLSQNKIMTRDNLRRRGIPKPMECSFCKEFESVHHLFFDCLVAKQIWSLVEEVFRYRVEKYLDIASRWLCNKKFLQFNFISSAVLWGIWNSRNSLVFNRLTWLNLKQVWSVILSYLRNWKVPFKDQVWKEVDLFMELLVRRIKAPLRLAQT
jgi:hypothetical protein